MKSDRFDAEARGTRRAYEAGKHTPTPPQPGCTCDVGAIDWALNPSCPEHGAAIARARLSQKEE